MPSTIPYSLAFVGIILTASLAVLGHDDPCFLKTTCKECVVTKTNITVGDEGGNNGTCIFAYTSSGEKCFEKISLAEGITSAIYKVEGCKGDSNTTTTTTVAPSTTSPATPPSPATTTTNSTTTSTTTAAPTTTVPANSTTSAPTTAPPSNSTTTAAPTTSPTPSNATTTAAPTPAPTPRKGGFAWGEFIGGIVFAVAISSLAYLIWRFYKARLDRNYHTFSNPTF